jgi:hypothetical protein
VAACVLPGAFRILCEALRNQSWKRAPGDQRNSRKRPKTVGVPKPSMTQFALVWHSSEAWRSPGRGKSKKRTNEPNPPLLILLRSAASKQKPALQVAGFCLCLVVGSGDLPPQALD